MNRSQRILQFVADSKKPVCAIAITAAIAKAEPQIENHKRLQNLVAANLCVLLTAGKLSRTGVRGAYLYATTETTFVDHRRRIEPPRPSVPKAAPKPVAAKPIEPSAAKLAKTAKPAPAKASRQAFTNLRPAAPRKPGERETVEQFLARGGRIQKLAHGESSQPAYIDVRAVDQRAMRERLRTALDTDPANTTDDNAVAA